MLTLPIKKKWFDMILTGEKAEEYRADSLYWRVRLKSEIKRQKAGDQGQGLRLILKNGYGKDSPKAVITLYGITKGVGVKKWGAEPEAEYIRLHIKEAKRYEG